MDLLLFGNESLEDDDADGELTKQSIGLGVDPAKLDEQAEPDLDAGGEEVFYLWPMHAPAFSFWQKCQTQWLAGFAGPTGLNYPGIDVLLKRNGFKGKAADKMFWEVQQLELGALTGFADRPKKPPGPT